MKARAFALTLALPLLAYADLVPPDVGVCQGQKAGAACTTSDGKPGVCRALLVSRADYSTGIPPKYRKVEVLSCEATASAQARLADVSWLPWGLAALAAALGTLAVGVVRRRRLPAS